MFEIGDKVVCIDNSSLKKMGGHWKTYLTNGKAYKILCKSNADLVSIYSGFYIINDRGIDMIYNNKRFVSLIDYRKQKLKKICGKLEIK